REKGFEQKYKLDKEQEFKSTARRNRLLGLWAAAEMKLPAAEHDAYAKSVVLANFEKPGDQDVVDKLLGDFKSHGIEISEHRLRQRMSEFMEAARHQIMTELK